MLACQLAITVDMSALSHQMKRKGIIWRQLVFVKKLKMLSLS